MTIKEKYSVYQGCDAEYEQVSEDVQESASVISDIKEALKCAERVVRTLQNTLAEAQYEDSPDKLDKLIEHCLANEDKAFLAVGEIARHHSLENGEQFAIINESSLPGIGLFKDSEKEYRLVLPPFRSIQYKGSNEYKGIGITEMVRDCCRAYEKKTGITLTPEMEYVRVTVTNYVRKWTSEAVDPGNTDCKAAIDALQGIIIKGDSMTNIEVLCRGEISENDMQYTEIKVTKKS